MNQKTVEEYNASLPIPIRLVFSRLKYDYGHSLAVFATVKGPDWKKDLWQGGTKVVGAGKSQGYHQHVRWQLIQRFWRHLGAA